MEENRKVSVSPSPSLEVVLVKGGFAPSWDVVPMGEQCQVLQDGSGRGALLATLWLLSLALRGPHRPGAGQSLHSFLPAPRETRGEKCAEYVENGPSILRRAGPSHYTRQCPFCSPAAPSPEAIPALAAAGDIFLSHGAGQPPQYPQSSYLSFCAAIKATISPTHPCRAGNTAGFPR